MAAMNVGTKRWVCAGPVWALFFSPACKRLRGDMDNVAWAEQSDAQEMSRGVAALPYRQHSLRIIRITQFVGAATAAMNAGTKPWVCAGQVWAPFFSPACRLLRLGAIRYTPSRSLPPY